MVERGVVDRTLLAWIFQQCLDLARERELATVQRPIDGLDAPAIADFPEPFKFGNYCRDDDPSVLIRGAKNAPRPAGDDTAGPPAGADLGERTSPSPEGRYSVPTPYGGPTLPIEPPK